VISVKGGSHEQCHDTNVRIIIDSVAYLSDNSFRRIRGKPGDPPAGGMDYHRERGSLRTAGEREILEAQNLSQSMTPEQSTCLIWLTSEFKYIPRILIS
jgi:hypothetical protein